MLLLMIGGRRTMASNFEVHEWMIKKKKSKEFFFIQKFKKIIQILMQAIKTFQ
jgi:hypothetical protein